MYGVPARNYSVNAEEDPHTPLALPLPPLLTRGWNNVTECSSLVRLAFNVLFARIFSLIWCGMPFQKYSMTSSSPPNSECGFQRTRWIINRVHNYFRTLLSLNSLCLLLHSSEERWRIAVVEYLWTSVWIRNYFLSEMFHGISQFALLLRGKSILQNSYKYLVK